MLSHQELTELKNECLYKDRELDLLSSFLQPKLELMMPCVLIDGPPSSGKSFTIDKYTTKLKNNHKIHNIIIECEYCYTQRDVLKKILKGLITHFKFNFTTLDRGISACEGLNNFPECIKQIMLEAQIQNKVIEPFIIILDKLDSLPDKQEPEILAYCLSKLHEQGEEMNGLSFVIVCTRTDWFQLVTSSIPTITFESYNEEEMKTIVSNSLIDEFWPVDLLDGNLDNCITEIQRIQIFKQFIGLMMDTYKGFFGSCLDIISPVLSKIWPIFIDPIIRKGKIINGLNDILSTFLKNKDILSKESSVINKLNDTTQMVDSDLNDNIGHYDLSKRTKYLVIASFLASYNESKYDMVYFTKNSVISGNATRKRRKIKRSNVSKGEGNYRREMASAQPFKLERLLAILKSIWEENEGNFNLVTDVELQNEIATLSSLKMLLKLRSGDTISGQGKWKCNVHWNVVDKFSRDLNFDIENHLQE